MAKQTATIKIERQPVEALPNSEKNICIKCMRLNLSPLANKMMERSGIHNVAPIALKKNIQDAVWADLREKYGVPCVTLGYEDGPIASLPYCAECLSELAALLKEEK
jgi:hypothetical protein